MSGVIGADFLVHAFVINARVGFADPCIDRIAGARDVVLAYGLAKSEIGFPIVSSQLHENIRFHLRNQIVCEGQVAGPVTDAARAIPSGAEAAVWNPKIVCCHSDGRVLPGSGGVGPQETFFIDFPLTCKMRETVTHENSIGRTLKGY